MIDHFFSLPAADTFAPESKSNIFSHCQPWKEGILLEHNAPFRTRSSDPIAADLNLAGGGFEVGFVAHNINQFIAYSFIAA
jgi:hypothetical protein